MLYSDEPRLIGQPFARSEEDRAAFSAVEAHAELSDLSGPENRFERQFGELLEVYSSSASARSGS